MIFIKCHFRKITKWVFVMYIHRTAENTIQKFSKQFKVLLITGARQVGKSTLLQRCDEHRNYVSLDDLVEREMAINEPQLFLRNHQTPLIIDEIQYAPQLLSYIKLIVDKSDKKGQYWLTGSQQFHLMKNISESLAGRVGIINLMGLSLSEISAHKNQLPFNIDLENNHKKNYSIDEIF